MLQDVNSKLDQLLEKLTSAGKGVVKQVPKFLQAAQKSGVLGIGGTQQLSKPLEPYMNPGSSFLSPALQKRGVSPLVAGTVGIATDIALPGPGEVKAGVKAIKMSKTAKTIAKSIESELDNLITKFAKNPTEYEELAGAKEFLKDPSKFKKAQEVVDLYSSREIPDKVSNDVLFSVEKLNQPKVKFLRDKGRYNGSESLKPPLLEEAGKGLEEVSKYVDEFSKMKKGDMVDNPDFKLPISKNAQFSRKSLKHFVEERQAAGNSKSEINYLLQKAPEVTEKPELNILNPNQNYKGSSLLGRFYPDSSKAVMVILDKGGEVRDIISLHFKNKQSFENLMKLYGK